MIHARVRDRHGKIQNDPPPEELHALLESDSCLAWLDLEVPTVDELGLLAGILGWEHLTVEDLARQGQRAKLERFEEYDLLVMHALSYEVDGTPPARLAAPEVDFVVGKNYVVTVHYIHLPQLTETRDVSEHCERLLSDGADHILYELTDKLVDSYFPVLDAMHDAVDELEDRIVSAARVIHGDSIITTTVSATGDSYHAACPLPAQTGDTVPDSRTSERTTGAKCGEHRGAVPPDSSSQSLVGGATGSVAGSSTLIPFSLVTIRP